MAVLRDVKNKIINISKIQKITRTMWHVAASKRLRAQKRMMASVAYATKIREVMQHIARSDGVAENIYMQAPKQVNKVGYIVVSSDHGLCGGLNINLFKKALEHAKHLQHQGVTSEWCLLGKKAAQFFHTLLINIIAQTTNLGNTPNIADLIGSIKVMLDAYRMGKVHRLFLVYNSFINTLIQKPHIEQLLPLDPPKGGKKYRNIYLYEPTTNQLLETLMTRYIEMQVYQAVVDNIACEQASRMVAMQEATDNSQEILDNLRLMYNKGRQASITRELTEVVSGAEAQLATR